MKIFLNSCILPAIFFLLFCLSCASAKDEGFAIYLTRNDTPPSKMEAENQPALSDFPVISSQDIVIYNAQTHELKLTAVAFERISKLDIHVSGKSFIVCANRQPVYWGAFWTPVSSISFDGVTIWKPIAPLSTPIITLELGYPSPAFYGGNDPRNQPDILKSLERNGKLIVKQSIASMNALPHSMKGYELYSWAQDNQWCFTLITGTNRNKTVDEIVTGEDYISESGWIKITANGTGGLKEVLSKLQPGEFVTWLTGMRNTSGQTDVTLQLPPKEIKESIREYTVQRGLNMQIPGY
jgi:hypothetical protein